MRASCLFVVIAVFLVGQFQSAPFAPIPNANHQLGGASNILGAHPIGTNVHALKSRTPSEAPGLLGGLSSGLHTIVGGTLGKRHAIGGPPKPLGAHPIGTNVHVLKTRATQASGLLGGVVSSLRTVVDDVLSKRDAIGGPSPATIGSLYNLPKNSPGAGPSIPPVATPKHHPVRSLLDLGNSVDSVGKAPKSPVANQLPSVAHVPALKSAPVVSGVSGLTGSLLQKK